MNNDMLNKKHRPIVITMGEPAGVGPEIICKIWKQRDRLALPAIIYVGSEDSLRAYDPDIQISLINDPSDAAKVPAGILPVYPIETPGEITPGLLNNMNGPAVIKAIDTAVSFVQAGNATAVVTAPIHKAALYDVGFSVPGHTEYLAQLSGMSKTASVMMLAAKDLRVIPVTTHIAIKDVPNTLTSDMIIHAGQTAHDDLQTRFNIEKPRIAIAALNPHAGENGAMGIEEVTHIHPAILAMRDMGIDVTDPLPSDTLFHDEARAQYDAVLCMYHDQALIPIKTIDFWGGVNVTLGLPFIRTSPDHGTALNIAGQGIVRSDSMITAIRMAADMVDNQAEKYHE
jgi:4-hydroxythreonine-4-phosphate dehydrogenase